MGNARGNIARVLTKCVCEQAAQTCLFKICSCLPPAAALSARGPHGTEQCCHTLSSNCFQKRKLWGKTAAPLLCQFLYLTCFVLLRELLGEWRLMRCLWSLKHSVFSISSDWSSPSLLLFCLRNSHSICFSFLFFFLFSRDIPRIPDSTHAQLESSESCQDL